MSGQKPRVKRVEPTRVRGEFFSNEWGGGTGGYCGPLKRKVKWSEKCSGQSRVK